VMDVEFQVPKKIANLVKLRRAEMLLESGGTPALPSEPAQPDLDIDEPEIFSDDDDLLSPSEVLTGGSGGTATATSVKSRSAERKASRRVVPVSDQERLTRERQFRSQQPEPKRRRWPTVLSLIALVIAMGAISVGVVKVYQDMQRNQTPDVADIPAPQPVPVMKTPEVPQEDFEMSRRSVERQDTFQRQAEAAKTRVRQTVRNLAENGGAWWSPWRVIRDVGGSVDRLVNGRQVSEVLEAFGATTATVEKGLRSERTLNYLSSVGYDLKGKEAEDLSARETFELLSAREIREADQIGSILENLLDKLARDKAAQAQRKANTRKAGETALMTVPAEAGGTRPTSVTAPSALEMVLVAPHSRRSASTRLGAGGAGPIPLKAPPRAAPC